MEKYKCISEFATCSSTVNDSSEMGRIIEVAEGSVWTAEINMEDTPERKLMHLESENGKNVNVSRHWVQNNFEKIKG